MTTQKIPGLSAVIVKEGKLAWAKGYGYANLEKQIPAGPGTVFMLASVSKTITATALMQLYEEGKFNLDDAVNDYLPFTVHSPSYPDVPVTFRHLLTHTSGIKDNWDILTAHYVNGDSPIELGDFLEDYLNEAGDLYNASSNFNTSSPGTKQEYSNIGATLIGYLVERISGKSFDKYTQDEIFSPLCMDRTSWFLSGLDTALIARPYTYYQGQYTDNGLYGYPDYPDGQLRTSAISLSKFLWTSMNNGSFESKSILQDSTVNQMFTIQKPNVDASQGLMWVKGTLSGRTVWGHTGGDAGVTTYMFMDRTKSTGVIILTNLGQANPIYILDKLFKVGDTISITGKLEISCALSRIVSNKQPEEKLKIYPNPGRNTLVIEAQAFSSTATMRLLSMTGQDMHASSSGPGTIVSLDVSHIPDGVYVLYVSDRGKEYRQKVIVQH